MKIAPGFLLLGLLIAGLFSAARMSEGATGTALVMLPSPTVADAGKEAFTEKCSTCHGVSGQGFIGPYIAGVNWGTSGMQTIVRVGIGGYGGMPAFNADAVTDKDIANIVVYLATLPPNNVPLAQHGTVITGNLINGQKLYVANCAACHGAAGQGGVGPQLHGENTRKDTAGTIFWIKNPILPMPKLYPKPLSEKDVSDVAAYVESL